MILLLDTSVIVDVLRDCLNRRSLLADLTEAGRVLATSAVSVGEVHAGLRPQEQQEAQVFLSSLVCYPVTRSIARLAGEQKLFYARQGRTIGLIDMIVAATALEHSLTLMTDNVKDFPNPDLTLYTLP